MYYLLKMKPSDYKLLDGIREIRNCWCHRGYFDFHYAEGIEKYKNVYQSVAQQLHYDGIWVYGLYQKIEKLRKNAVKTQRKIILISYNLLY